MVFTPWCVSVALRPLLLPLVVVASEQGVLHSGEVYQESHDIVARINRRFTHGRPSNSFDKAGVLVHQFDDAGIRHGWDSFEMDPVGLDAWHPWLPCPPDQWCARFADRISTSLVNAQRPDTFSQLNAGIVIAPKAARKAALCYWATDGHGFRKSRTCTAQAMQGHSYREGDFNPSVRIPGCVPGCINERHRMLEDNDTVTVYQWAPTWCEAGGENIWCPWLPDNLQGMMEQQEVGVKNNPNNEGHLHHDRYNEVVLSSDELYLTGLPHSVEAFYYMRNATVGHSSHHSHEDRKGLWLAEAKAKAAHATFLRTFCLTSAQVPLLELDLNAPPSVTPFREVVNEDEGNAAAIDAFELSDAHEMAHRRRPNHTFLSEPRAPSVLQAIREYNAKVERVERCENGS